METVLLTPTPATVALAIERIVQAARPARIIAFGSRARGEYGPESDVDLLVVLPGNSEDPCVSADIYEAVGALGFSKDILISNEQRLARLDASIHSVQVEAAREGVTLYENGCTDRVAIEKICR
jgi:uncharacterized protein